MKHTPLPWEAIPAKDEHGDETISIRGDAQFIAMMDLVSIDGGPYHKPPNCYANAQMIVKAVNCHDELLTALKEALPYVEGAYECAFPNVIENDAVVKQIKAAIDKAEGGNV